MTTIVSTESIRNGVDTKQLFDTLDAIVAEPSLGRFQFRVRNEWVGGAHNRGTIRGFYGAGQEDTSRVAPFVVDAGEPAVLCGTDTGPNPAELLASRRMTEVIERLTREADMVIFDSPPVIAVTDAAVLAAKVDGVLLVISAGKTKRDLAQKAKSMLEKVNARIVGVVLNNAKYDTAIHDYYAHTGDNN